jgi:WD40 repeat protein
MDTGVTLRVLEGHLTGVQGVAVRAPTKRGVATQVFSASNDGTVRRWDVAPLPHQHLLDVPGEAWAAAVAPDGNRVAVGFADGSLRLYTLPEGRLFGEAHDAHANATNRLVFSAEGAWLASASHDDTAKLWSISGDGELTLEQTFTGHNDSVYGIALSPDGKTLATASFDGKVGLFGVDTKDEGRFIDAHDKANSVEFDVTGTKLLSVGDDKIARLWDLTTDPPALIREFSGAQDKLMWAALSPNGRLVATVGRDWLVDIYKADDGQLIHRLAGHEQTVWRAIFCPDGRQLTTVSGDATVRFGDLVTGAELFALRLPAERAPANPLWDFDFRCTPTGCWIAVPLTRGKLALYDLGPYAK